jgi:electron transfer flavoprotein beta subunit
MNAVDKNAVEEAIRLKEAAPDTEVVAVSMGPNGATECLRTALALGADRAVLVSDEVAAGSDLIATAKVLAKVLDHLEVDLALFGQQSSDGGAGLLWAAVADLLRRPVASQAAELTVGDGHVRVARQTEVGDEVIEVRLPAIVGVSDSINEPRYTSLKGVMGAKKKPLEVLTVAEIGLEASEVGAAGSRTQVLGMADLPPRRDTLRVEGDSEVAEAIVDFLIQRQLV